MTTPTICLFYQKNADKYLEATPGSQESTVSTQQQMEGPGPVAVAVPPETDDDSDVSYNLCSTYNKMKELI